MTTKATEPAQAAPAVGCQVEQPVRPLVERLRSYSADEMLCDRYADAMQDAAEEIDRLSAHAATYPDVSQIAIERLRGALRYVEGWECKGDSVKDGYDQCNGAGAWDELFDA